MKREIECGCVVRAVSAASNNTSIFIIHEHIVFGGAVGQNGADEHPI